ncbi:MAG: hypothetical protein SR1Q7_05065, partial [Quinella sp. 1Q7]|nr:hypothetical protein [Quinella sp. 1Q7]
VTFTLPEGGFTVNGAAFTLSGDDNVQLTDDGKTIDGMDNGAIITLGSAGEYAINGTSVTAEAGDVYGINRDGFYKADADNMPITEGTPYANILALGASSRYVDESASGAQSITLGNRDEVALIDSSDAPTNVTTGNGNDSVVVRHGAEATVDTANGDNTLIVTNGRVTLENYSASNASVKTFDYSNVPAAVRNNSIKFGDGVMTLGDGVITFDGNGSVKGATLTEIVDATGNGHNIGFTHTAGGNLNTSAESANYLHKGNYAEKTSDTQKSAGSSITGGSGNDTLLIGANDYANAGGGTNQIYITDASLRSAAATIVLSDGNTNVRNFNGGFNTASDVIRVNDLSALEFGAGTAGLTMTSGDAQMTFDDMTPELIDVSGVNSSMRAAGGYNLKVADGNRNYNVAVAQDGQALAVTDAADIYYGNANGMSFTEYAGTVQVNLSNGTGTIGGTASTIKGGATKLAAGTGDATLTGSDGNETLYGGLGNATLNGGAGADLMIGNTSSLKSGSTKFVYTGGNGLDTIRNMDFMANAGDGVNDEVLVDVTGNVITSVNVNGSNVSIGLNGDASDNLTILNARGQHFKFNDLVAKVDSVVAYDGYTDCYVGVGNNPTVRVAANMGDVAIWLSGEDTMYLGDIAAINASAATGNNTLAGNDVNNLIVGGRGKNSIWGGEFATNDTLVGGSGQNTFFFQYANGQDVIQGAHDGDVVELVALTLDNIASTAITGNGVSIDLKDGSRLEVQSAANVEYKLSDGTSYTADHTAREWRQK